MHMKQEQGHSVYKNDARYYTRWQLISSGQSDWWQLNRAVSVL